MKTVQVEELKAAIVSTKANQELVAQIVEMATTASPNDGLIESLPLEFSGSFNFGWDDNITATVKVHRRR